MWCLSSGTGEGGIARQDLAAVGGSQPVEGADRGLQRGGVGLGLGEPAAEVGASRTNQQAGGLAQGAESGAAFGEL